MQKKSLILLLACLLVISIAFGGCTSMQSKSVIVSEKYPTKPITFIVPFGAGGAMDLVARLLEKSSVKHLGQPMVIINKPGSAGILGWNELVSSAPDGYTIGISASELFLHPLYGSVKYNYPTALEPLAQISSTPFVMTVQSDQPWQSVNDLIRYAEQHPGELKFGHSGIGSLSHVLGETFSKSAAITLRQVPFRSSAESVTALLGGHVQILFSNPGSVKEYVKSGMLKVLAVSGQKRLTDQVFAGTPTFQEQGFPLIYSSQYGLVAPKEMPADIKAKLVEGLRSILTDPEFKNDIETLGLQYEYLDADQSKKQWLHENKELTKAVQNSGIIELIQSQKQ